MYVLAKQLLGHLWSDGFIAPGQRTYCDEDMVSALRILPLAAGGGV